MKTPKISVIMPCYNGAESIASAIESFLEQTYHNKELIVVDGKSTDKSHAIIAGYINKYENIKWLKETDTCVTDALNIGIKSSDAMFIGFLMTDDHYIHPDFFSKGIQLAQYIDFDVLYSNTYYYLTLENRREVTYWRPEHQLNRTEMLKKGSSVAIIDSTIIKKSVLEKYPLDPDYNLCSDYDFFLKIADEKHLFIYLDIYTTCCFYDGNNLSARNYKIQMQMFSKVGIKFLDAALINDDFLLFHKIAFEKLTLSSAERGKAEKLFIQLLKANNERNFYPQVFFKNYVIALWIRVNQQLYHGVKAKYYIYSSPIFNNVTISTGGVRSKINHYIHKFSKSAIKLIK